VTTDSSHDGRRSQFSQHLDELGQAGSDLSAPGPAAKEALSPGTYSQHWHLSYYDCKTAQQSTRKLASLPRGNSCGPLPFRSGPADTQPCSGPRASSLQTLDSSTWPSLCHPDGGVIGPLAPRPLSPLASLQPHTFSRSLHGAPRPHSPDSGALHLQLPRARSHFPLLDLSASHPGMRCLSNTPVLPNPSG
jgi:hypothetical protein